MIKPIDTVSSQEIAAWLQQVDHTIEVAWGWTLTDSYGRLLADARTLIDFQQQRHTALLAGLDALVKEMREAVTPLKVKGGETAYWAERLAVELDTHRGARA